MIFRLFPPTVRSRAFTLIEQLLTVVLLLLLLGAVVYNFTSFNRTARLDEGASQVEALLRFARAHAASTGRQVRIEFPDSAVAGESALALTPTASVRVTWEPDPIGAPGVFHNLPEAANYVQSITDLVNVQEVRLNQAPSEAATQSGEQPAEASLTENSVPLVDASHPSMPSVKFYPDGTGDSAQLVLGSHDESDTRRLSVRVVGLTGSIRRRLVCDASAPESAPSAPATEAAAEAGK